MFRRVLIANRGEIALRIIQALREMNMESVLICSSADKQSLPAMMATETICVGGAKPSESYLQGDMILDVAKKMKCDAVHPGYGFLSENAAFAEGCEKAGITFIGPSSELIRKMGDKQAARELMRKNGIPVVPGSRTLIPDVETAKREAEAIGYPVLVKATAGGGGKGMRKAWNETELATAFEQAKTEARNAFGDDGIYIEKLIEDPRHIEVQILADRHGHVIHLGERNCSMQKNHQKLLEESPALGLSAVQREKMYETAVRAASLTKYDSVGTIEFLVDQEENFYFIEMNTRIQVEHPVTEEVTGVDLIREQIRVAAGKKLSVSQMDACIKGHALECRINALSPGKVETLHFPNGYGMRVESSLYEGYEILPYYDAMLVKLIAVGKTRLEAIRRMRRALEELVIEGVQTNTKEMYLLTWQPEFMLGTYTTSFWEKYKEMETKA